MGATMGVAIRPQDERRRTESLFAPAVEPCGCLKHAKRYGFMHELVGG